MCCNILPAALFVTLFMVSAFSSYISFILKNVSALAKLSARADVSITRKTFINKALFPSEYRDWGTALPHEKIKEKSCKQFSL